MRGSKIVVAHAVPDLLYGGLQRLTVDIVQRVDRAEFESHVLVFGEMGPLAEQVGGSATLHQVPSQSKLSMLRPSGLVSLLRRIRPDVLHSHSGVWYKASLAGRMAGVRWLVHTDHGRMVPDPLVSRILDRLASRRTDVTVAVSDTLGEQLRRRVVARPDRVRVLLNGVDTDALRPGMTRALRAELGLSKDQLVIGSIGRLERIKGYDLMVEAFARFLTLPECPPAVLVIAGDGSERSELVTLAGRLGVQDRVRFLGWRPDLPRLLGSFDLFALTSRSEGTSVSLLEAMSAGVCPVVTAVGGNPGVLGPELARRLVAPESPDAIARGWAAALSNPTERVADGATGRRLVEARFSLQSMIRGYQSIYREGSLGA